MNRSTHRGSPVVTHNIDDQDYLQLLNYFPELFNSYDVSLAWPIDRQCECSGPFELLHYLTYFGTMGNNTKYKRNIYK